MTVHCTYTGSTVKQLLDHIRKVFDDRNGQRNGKASTVKPPIQADGFRSGRWFQGSFQVRSWHLRHSSYILNHLGTVSMFGESLQIDGIRKEAKPQISKKHTVFLRLASGGSCLS